MKLNQLINTMRHQQWQHHRQRWWVVDSGSRYVKCVLFEVHRERVAARFVKVIDIQEEGLLSGEEVGTAIGRTLQAVAAGVPVAVVVPQATGLSQVIEVQPVGGETMTAALQGEIESITGLAAGRFISGSVPLAAGRSLDSGSSGCFWVTIAREDGVTKLLAPLLAEGLPVESVTSAGNALCAGFSALDPQRRERVCLVDFGASQTTLVRMEQGQPSHMGSLPNGGEEWVEALLDAGSGHFDDWEKRLLEDDLRADPLLLEFLRGAVKQWREAIFGQLREWGADWHDAADADNTRDQKRDPLLCYVYGGWAKIPGLFELLNEDMAGAGVRFEEGPSATAKDETTVDPGLIFACEGAARIAAGHRLPGATILPMALANMKRRRKNVDFIGRGALAVLALLVGILCVASFERRAKIATLEEELMAVRAVDAELASASLLWRERDRLAEAIAPVVDRRVRSIEALQALSFLQDLTADITFTIMRFGDRRSYFQSRATPELRRGREAVVNGDGDTIEHYRPGQALGLQAIIVDVFIPGEAGEQLETLGELVAKMRESGLFSNVDRLVARPDRSAAEPSWMNGESFALVLTLNDQAHTDWQQWAQRREERRSGGVE